MRPLGGGETDDSPVVGAGIDDGLIAKFDSGRDDSSMKHRVATEPDRGFRRENRSNHQRIRSEFEDHVLVGCDQHAIGDRG